MLKLYNSLTRQIEDFKPINPSQVGMYVCGPTVYQFAHIGNFRAYATSDLLARVLRYNGYDVKFVMNITDVGHMTEDEIGGGDAGEDKVEKTARTEGKSVWEVAGFYTERFLEDYEALHLTQPDILCKATDHIREQIDLIRVIEEKGFTYKTSDGIYFDTAKLSDYGKMSSLDQVKEGARVDVNDEKKNPRDFALWKFSPAGERRQMEWNSPWGKGFPGWHIECSAMSMKYLGKTFDMHTGGIDHKEIHHPNEIAQSKAATGRMLANYWVHTAFMLVAGQKMSKSLGNIYTLYDLEKQDYHLLALRYLYLQTHYRQEMNFTFAALDGASNALKNLLEEISGWEDPKISKVHVAEEEDESAASFEERFLEAVNDDLNMPKALAVMWELVKSDNPTGAKSRSLFKMDQILGLDLQKAALHLKKEQGIVPAQIAELVRERESLRKKKKFNAADQIRAQIERMGYEIEDNKKGTIVRKK